MTRARQICCIRSALFRGRLKSSTNRSELQRACWPGPMTWRRHWSDSSDLVVLRPPLRNPAACDCDPTWGRATTETWLAPNMTVDRALIGDLVACSVGG